MIALDFVGIRGEGLCGAGKGKTHRTPCGWAITYTILGVMRKCDPIYPTIYYCESSPFKDQFHGHVITGIMSLIENQRLRNLIAKGSNYRENININWKEAEKKVAPWFGSLEEEGGDRTGKVIFLDAYPLPRPEEEDANPNSGGLKMDMANNIWSWADSELEYKPNPNPFFSLSKSYFVVGLRPRVSDKDRKIIEQVTKWLKDGLAAGVGSQVNTGYGVVGMSSQTPEPFLKVPFTLEGQLIHGHQLVKWQNDKERFNNTAQEEVRPAAIKSMLRYWFRALALGILPPGTPQDVVNYQKRIEKGEASNPPATVKALEAQIGRAHV